MLSRIKVKDMIGNLEGHLGDDDYSEPLEILINSANNHNKFNLYGAFAFKNQLKDRLKMRSRLNDFMQNKVLPSPADPIFVTGLPGQSSNKNWISWRGKHFILHKVIQPASHLKPVFKLILKSKCSIQIKFIMIVCRINKYLKRLRIIIITKMTLKISDHILYFNST